MVWEVLLWYGFRVARQTLILGNFLQESALGAMAV